MTSIPSSTRRMKNNHKDLGRCFPNPHPFPPNNRLQFTNPILTEGPCSPKPVRQPHPYEVLPSVQDYVHTDTTTHSRPRSASNFHSRAAYTLQHHAKPALPVLAMYSVLAIANTSTSTSSLHLYCKCKCKCKYKCKASSGTCPVGSFPAHRYIYRGTA
jgi:hypothetical protein